MDLLKFSNASDDVKRRLRVNGFLKMIASDNGQSKYKMVNLSPLRYSGGKSRGVGYLLENLPREIPKKIVSIFFGGGAFEICISKLFDIEVIGYDIFDLLVNYWQHQINNPKGIYEELKKLSPDKKTFEKIRHVLINYWEKNRPETLNYETKKKIPLTKEEKSLLDDNPLLLAAYFYFNFQLSHIPMFLGWVSYTSIEPRKYGRTIRRVRDFKGGNIEVKCKPFQQSIPEHQGDFLYCDPPYFLGGSSSVFRGLYPNSNFPIYHEGFDHHHLKKLLDEHEGGFLLSYNDCEEIRELYSKYKMVFPKWQYSLAQGDDYAKDDLENQGKGKLKESSEVIIISMP